VRTNASETCSSQRKASALATAAFVLGVLPGWHASADAAEVSSAEGPSSTDGTGNGSDKDVQESSGDDGLAHSTNSAETATPVTVISSEDIQSHGFADVVALDTVRSEPELQTRLQGGAHSCDETMCSTGCRPWIHSYPGTSSQPYDEFDYNVYGRTFYLTANYNLGNDAGA